MNAMSFSYIRHIHIKERFQSSDEGEVKWIPLASFKKRKKEKTVEDFHLMLEVFMNH